MNETHFPELSVDNIPEQITFSVDGKLYELSWSNDRNVTDCSKCPLNRKCDAGVEDYSRLHNKPNGLFSFCCHAQEVLDDFYNDSGRVSIIDLEKHPEASYPPFHNRLN